MNNQLIHKCIKGERSAQNELYGLLLPYLTGICKRYLYDSSQLQDVLQEAFILVFTNLSQFDACKASLQTWVGQITINCCLKNNAKRSKSQEDMIEPPHEIQVLPQVLKRLSNEDMLRWLKRMPTDYFEVFNLYIVDGFSHREIAEILSIDEALSRQRLSRARTWIKKKLPDNFRYDIKMSYN